jgi:hypothetical protein
MIMLDCPGMTTRCSGTLSLATDEVWFNAGDDRYYLGASKAIKPTGSPLGSGAVLGIVNDSSVLSPRRGLIHFWPTSRVYFEQ